MFSRWRPWALVGALAVGLVAPGISADSKKEKKEPKRKVVPAVKVDESLDHIDVFEGIEKGVLDVKMIPKDAMGGTDPHFYMAACFAYVASQVRSQVASYAIIPR